jgi:cytosine/uracil/thiamine/allantoin permease
MKQSIRILVAGIIIECLLASIGALLLNQLATGKMRPTNSVAETASVITSTLGMAMGAIGGIVMVMFFVTRRREG